MVNSEVEVKLEANLSEIGNIIDQLLPMFKDYPVYLLRGDLGAGKTTLVTRMAQNLGINDPTSSPTFSLINEYKLPSGDSLYHIDLYRINSTAEALDLGILEYIESGNVCLIEWPEIIEEFLHPPFLAIDIEEVEKNKRQYTISKYD